VTSKKLCRDRRLSADRGDVPHAGGLSLKSRVVEYRPAGDRQSWAMLGDPRENLQNSGTLASKPKRAAWDRVQGPFVHFASVKHL